jgi:hypothetical protein
MSPSCLTFSLAMLTQDSVDTNTLTLQVMELLHGKLTPTTLTPFLPLVPRLLQSAILGSRSLWEERGRRIPLAKPRNG